MAEHIITFSKYKDDRVVKPKDKLKFIFEDKRKNKYRLYDKRFILTTS